MDGGRGSTSLVLDTKGICVLCFKQSDTLDKPHWNPHLIGGGGGADNSQNYLTLPNYSIQRLARFLNISIRDLLSLLRIPTSNNSGLSKTGTRAYQDSPDPPNLKVSLCPGCASVTEEFSELHEQLDKIQLQISHCLSRLCDRVRIGEGEGGRRKEAFWRRMAANQRDLSYSDLVEKFRKEAVQKCAHRFNTEIPRVILRQVSTAEIRKYKLEAPPPPPKEEEPDKQAKTSNSKINTVVEDEDDRGSSLEMPTLEPEVELEVEDMYEPLGEGGDYSSPPLLVPQVDPSSISPSPPPGWKPKDQNVPHKCHICGMKFRRKVHLCSHLSLRHTHPNGGAPGSSESLRSYKVTSTTPSRASPAPPPPPGNIVKDPPKRSAFSCKLCPKSFQLGSSLVRHIRQKHGEIQHPHQVKCHLCHHKPFKYAYLLRRHNLRCHPRKTKPTSHAPPPPLNGSPAPHRCANCGKDYSTKSALNKHVAIVHERRYHVSCRLCKKQFKYPFLLQTHILRSHKNSTSSRSYIFPCSFCDRKFKQRRDRNRHLASTHNTGDPSRQCPVCAKTFAYPADLKKHLDKAHALPQTYPSTGESRG